MSPVPVLMYHDLDDGDGTVSPGHAPYVLTVARFRQQMSELAASGLTCERLDACLAPGGPGERGAACVITFDDGHVSNYEVALPALVAGGLRATFFLTAGWMGRKPYLTWEQVRALAGAGMEIGSHSMTHRPPASLTLKELRVEMTDSRRLIEDRTGHAVATASSPTGFFHPALPDVARESGYLGLCYSRIGLWLPGDDPFRIPRLPIKPAVDLPTFGRLVRGDRRLVAGLRRRQAVRDGLKRLLGVRGYSAARRWIMGGGKGGR